MFETLSNRPGRNTPETCGELSPERTLGDDIAAIMPDISGNETPLDPDVLDHTEPLDF